jgi:hypothetical protein
MHWRQDFCGREGKSRVVHSLDSFAVGDVFPMGRIPSQAAAATGGARQYLCHFPPDVHEYFAVKAARQRVLAGGLVTINKVIIDLAREQMAREVDEDYIEYREPQNGSHRKGKGPKRK